MAELDDNLEADASELVLTTDEQVACESFLFEPSSNEESLGSLYAVGETTAAGGGKELLDAAIQAAQQEYYRDVSRGVLASFESALHQANLVLHDANENGLREWLGSWHAAIVVLANHSLHVSTAGNAVVYLVRRSKVTEISEDLSYSPITNPLRTFSQVASGNLSARDTLYLGTAALPELFRREDLARFAMEPAAATITTRLQQLYVDQHAAAPLGTIAVSLTPRNVAVARPVMQTPEPTGTERHRDLAAPLKPREPLVIHRTVLRSIIALVVQAAVSSWRWIRTSGLPLLVRGSKQGGKVVASASAATGRNMQALTKLKPPKVSPQQLLSGPARLRHATAHRLTNLPRTSKVFALVSLVLAVALVVSLLFLQQKRRTDAEIEHASEILHDAQTKQTAAETALIYDNRDQAHALLEEARTSLASLAELGLYQDEQEELTSAIAALDDRLQRVVRSSTADTAVLGDFGESLGDASPTSLTNIGEELYTYHPVTNAVVSLSAEGTASIVSDSTAGIGFFSQAIPHQADKTIVLLTDTPGVALFDAKEETISSQAIQFAASESTITSGATFGNRLYLYDSATKNIYSFNKSLSGYGVGTPWVAAADFPADSIVSLAVDGSIYTLHTDGAVRELFKGEPQEDFSLEPVTPSLAGATKLITNEDMQNMYVFDPANKRVAIFTKQGELVEQLVLDVATKLSDVAISADESTLYALDGTRVLTVPLNQE